MDPPGERAARRARPRDADDRALGLGAARRRPRLDPTTTVFYFYGTAPGQRARVRPEHARHDRGRRHDRDPRQGPDDRRHCSRTRTSIGTLVHETSHILVSDYGEHPGTTTDSGSFDRYRDEFRAYFVEPGGVLRARSRPTPAPTRSATTWSAPARAPAATPTSTPPSGPTPHATNTFRTQVLAHRRPDGFNLDNSPYLDRLVHLLRDQQAGRATVEDDALPDHRPLPRRAHRGRRRDADHDAARPPARRRRGPHPPRADLARRGRLRARAQPGRQPARDRVPGGGDRPARRRRSSRPTGSATPTDRGNLSANAHFLSWLGRVLPSETVMRTCITVMAHGRSFLFFERTRRAAVGADRRRGRGRDARARCATALRGLTFEARLAYIGLCRTTATRALQRPRARPSAARCARSCAGTASREGPARRRRAPGGWTLDLRRAGQKDRLRLAYRSADPG